MAHSGADMYGGAAFRDTAFHGDLKGGRRHLSHKNQYETLDEDPKIRPSRASPVRPSSSDADPQVAAGGPSVKPERPIMRHFSELPPGGRTHLSVDGSLTVNEEAMHRSELAAQTGLSGFAPSIPLRGRPGVRPMQTPGGNTTVVLGSDNIVYECGTKEAHFRIAQDDGLRRAAIAEVPAGGRRVEAVQRTNGRMVGGVDHMPDVWRDGTGPAGFNEGMDEAQRRGALDPVARAKAAALEVAGRRVDRAQGLRITRPGGAAESYQLAWNAEPPALSGRHSASSISSESDTIGSARMLRHEQPVGGNSSNYLAGPQPSQVAALLTTQTDTAAPGEPLVYGTRRVPSAPAAASSVASMLAYDGSTMGPVSPRAPKHQPVGGRGMLVAGLHGLDDADPKVGGRPMAPHAVSTVVFG